MKRGAIDVARSLALLVVVFGHLILAIIDRDSTGQLRGANLLALYPQYVWLTLIAPMPLFFAAGGWANATASAKSSVQRLRTLIGLAAVVVTMWSAVSTTEILITGESRTLSDGARLATQPLWFLTAYIPFAAYGKRIARMAQRPVLSIATSLFVLACVDVARFGFSANDKWGWPSFFLAWGIPWVLGAWWRNASQRPTFNEKYIGAAIFVAGAIACVFLIKCANYYPALIDAVPNKRSNTTPPTLFTAVAAITQTGLLMLCGSILDVVATRWRSTISAVGRASIAVYAWHLSALALCAGLVSLGMYAPTRFSTQWWLTRPLWFGLVIVVTAFFVAATSMTHTKSSALGSSQINAQRFHIAVVIAVVGGAVIGLYGPRTLPGAAIASFAFSCSWWCLRAASSIDFSLRFTKFPQFINRKYIQK